MANRTVTIEIRIDASQATQPLQGLNQAVSQFGAAAGSTETGWLGSLSKIGFAWFGVQQVIGLVQGSVMSLSAGIQGLIQQSVDLQSQVLGTATSIAGTSKVFVNGIQQAAGKESILALTKPVEEAIDYVREQTFELVGVTSNDVIPVFRLVAQNAADIGTNIKGAADLSIKFAAAMGTVGVPLYQAGQEVNSILRGTIDQNSILAKTLGINNEMVRNWKAQGTLVEELNKRLDPFREGNKLAAAQLGGVTSNIQELFDEFRRFAGEPLLDPIIANANKFYGFLLENRQAIRDISTEVGERLATGLDKVFDLAGSLGETVLAVGEAFTGILNFQSLDRIISGLSIVVDIAGSILEAIQQIAQIAGPFITGLINNIAMLTPGVSQLFAVLDSETAKRNVAGIREEFDLLVTDFDQRGIVAEDRILSLKEGIKAAYEAGQISQTEFERLGRILGDVAVKSKEAADAQDLSTESINKGAQAAEQAAQAYKKAADESKLAISQAQLELEELFQSGSIGLEDYAERSAEISREEAQRRVDDLQAQYDATAKFAEDNKDKLVKIETDLTQAKIALVKAEGKEKDTQQKEELKRIKEAADLAKIASDEKITAIERESKALDKQTKQLAAQKTLYEAQIGYLEAIADSQTSVLDDRDAWRDAEIKRIRDTANADLEKNKAEIAHLEEVGALGSSIRNAQQRGIQIEASAQRKIREQEKERLADLQIRQKIEDDVQEKKQAAALASLKIEKQIELIKQRQLEMENQRATIQSKLAEVQVQRQIQELQTKPENERDPVQLELLNRQLALQQQATGDLQSQQGTFAEQRKQLEEVYRIREDTLNLQQAEEDKALDAKQTKELEAQAAKAINTEGKTQKQIQAEIAKTIDQSAKASAGLADGFTMANDKASGLSSTLTTVEGQISRIQTLLGGGSAAIATPTGSGGSGEATAPGTIQAQVQQQAQQSQVVFQTEMRGLQTTVIQVGTAVVARLDRLIQLGSGQSQPDSRLEFLNNQLALQGG